jgi:hypothetical protein
MRLLRTALILGGGALAVGVVIAGPALLRQARPLVRAGLKRGLGVYARARAAAEELVEDVEDLVAEVRAEMAPERSPPAPTPPAEAAER